jgi:hypothetical protein
LRHRKARKPVTLFAVFFWMLPEVHFYFGPETLLLKIIIFSLQFDFKWAFGTTTMMTIIALLTKSILYE